MTKPQLHGTLALVGLMLAGGGLHGWNSDRWKSGVAQLQAVTQRLPSVPLEFGEWEGTAEAVDDTEQFARAGIDAYLYRRYTRPRDGATFTVMAVIGRPGPISVHTPDVCYRAAGYDLESPAQKKEIAGTGAFWVGRFVQSRAAVPGRMTIYWTWSADGGWTAPAVPRLAFARKPALIKVYLLSERAGSSPSANDPADAFLRDFLPILGRTVFGTPDGPS